MKYDTIVIAGTTEAREVIDCQLRQGHKVLACVATELGAEMLEGYKIDVHTGRLDPEGFQKLFRDNPCDRVIDASHPFAKLVTKTVREAARQMNIPCERYERKELQYEYDRIIYVSDANEAVKRLNEIPGNILLTTGVNTAAVYAAGVTDAKNRVYIRVLNNAASCEGCRKAGYPESHIFGEMPPFTLEDNLKLIQKTDAKALVTKDSGKTGGVDIKVEACKEAGIPLVMIRRPGGE